ncbi:DEAD/DEAH box helicase family protein [Candidatus Woesebacteria bacterium]|nr:DEAD/DEAH box helicase family protein [Candidatus Woesebacteria bacterium]
MDKSIFSERDICTKYIAPALVRSGWNVETQIREEVFFTKGRIIVQDKVVKRGQPKRADYILYHKPNLPLAIIEAKDNNHSVGAGMQQGLEYAETLDIPFVFSSNGDGFIFHDRTGLSSEIEKQLSLDEFPTPQELYQKFLRWKHITPEEEAIVTTDYHVDIRGKGPRYYQQIAINRTIEAVANDQDRILLVMATGTGKTYTAFQIMWRLWKSRSKKRILFLADRNILIDQAKNNDLIPFGDKLTKITNRHVDKSYEVYMSLYQAVTGTEEESNIYKQFSPDFFDLIIIDECHRGSARADSAWREILEYFGNATQIGLTATPKETKDVSNIDYFGEPIYTYSLKQGIDDGFLAPYKVVRITIDRDVEGYRPENHKVDVYGREIPDEVYYGPDFDRTLIIDDRTKLVAKKVVEYLRETDPFSKTIIFCIDVEHAERMRQALVNEAQDLYQQNPHYVMRITGDDEAGKAELDNFIDPESKYPVIVTTSKLLTTGVDVQTCKVVVLDANINSMTEFKQIVGRGTRLREDFGKYFFTIMDFRNATDNFADPNFDGMPESIYEPVMPAEIEGKLKEEASISTASEILYDPTEPADPLVLRENGQPYTTSRKYQVRDVLVKVTGEQVQFLDEQGKLIAQNLEEFCQSNLKNVYPEPEDFVHAWNQSDNKKFLLSELEVQGIFVEELLDSIDKKLDEYDLILKVGYGKEAKTRQQRRTKINLSQILPNLSPLQSNLIEVLLGIYEAEGVSHIEDVAVLEVGAFAQFGRPYEILTQVFTNREEYAEAVQTIIKALYQE